VTSWHLYENYFHFRPENFVEYQINLRTIVYIIRGCVYVHAFIQRKILSRITLVTRQITCGFQISSLFICVFTVIHFTNVQLHFWLFWTSSFRRLLSSDLICSELFLVLRTSPPTSPWLIKVKVKVTLRLTVGQSVSLGVEPHPGVNQSVSVLLTLLCRLERELPVEPFNFLFSDATAASVFVTAESHC
jgi:hypothetical protein